LVIDHRVNLFLVPNAMSRNNDHTNDNNRSTDDDGSEAEDHLPTAAAPLSRSDRRRARLEERSRKRRRLVQQQEQPQPQPQQPQERLRLAGEGDDYPAVSARRPAARTRGRRNHMTTMTMMMTLMTPTMTWMPSLEEQQHQGMIMMKKKTTKAKI